MTAWGAAAGVSTLTIGARATDVNGAIGNAPDVVVNVVPDPGTTAVGLAVDGTGQPVAGATVSIASGCLAGDTLKLVFNETGKSTLSITGAPVVSLGNLTLVSGKLSLSTTNAKLLLQIAGLTQVGSGVIDLAGNDMVIHNGNLAQVQSQLKLGYNAGRWNGPADSS